MTKLNRLIAIAALGLALAACKDNQKATGGTADGEILPGSASDAMLPLDNVRSQAPLAPHIDTSADGGKDAANTAETEAAGDVTAPAEQVPATDLATPASAGKPIR
jgi:hypothetical protein